MRWTTEPTNFFHCPPSAIRRSLFFGAHDRDRTGDLVLTKDVLCQLSYVGPPSNRPIKISCKKIPMSAAHLPFPCGEAMERVMGIEPTPSAWKAEVLPLNYTRRGGGGGRIRTSEGISQQIYSLPPLAAWVPLRGHKSRLFSLPTY